MKRKTAVKKLMGYGMSRNEANSPCKPDIFEKTYEEVTHD